MLGARGKKKLALKVAAPEEAVDWSCSCLKSIAGQETPWSRGGQHDERIG